MAVDFLHEANAFKRELQEFYRMLRRGGTAMAKKIAVARLRQALVKVEPLAEDPGPHWERLSTRQRWAYLQLVSHVGTAMHELRRLGVGC